ncbi:relaxin-3 [Octodon degus]|uniref:Relaxin-3 n=1 Tax=Octodon degus TaxID=10160 RepID=A0A6P3FDP5_OCTDE|nr:relaxin-3 [Octodon degus]
MARRALLLLPLLLAVWMRDPGAEGRAAPYGVKLCGREFIRAVIFTCGGSRWRRADALELEAAVDAFEGVDGNADSLAGEPDDAVGSSEWLALVKSPQAFYSGRPSWQGSPGPLRGSRDVLGGLSSTCCKWGCSKSEISSLC